MKTLQTKQWFLDRIGKRVFRDNSGCGCPTCNDIVENGLIIRDKEHALHMYEVQNDYANENTYLNYKDEKNDVDNSF